MKEIGKLLELLNEYHHFNSDLIYYGWDEEYERVYFHTELPEKTKKELGDALIGDGIDEQRVGNEWICSKKFGFIKWLVENDKIDREKFGNSETKSSKYSDFELSYNTPREDYTNILLMELAIQDEPIQFLIEILR